MEGLPGGRRFGREVGLTLLLCVFAACGGEDEGHSTARETGAPAAPFRFVDVAAQAGVRTVAWCGREEKPHLLESGGNGLALFDYDADGDLDLYVVSGWRLKGAEVVERGRNALYRNRGDGTFEDVTEAAGVGDDSWGCGAATGDYDGDGDLDLYVTNFGPDVLYRNEGDGSFTRVENAPGIDGWSAGAVFFDADKDGDLDLFVAGYIECALNEVLRARPALFWKGMNVMLGPFGLEGEANRFFENTGGGRFVDATKKAGLEDVGLYFSFAVAAVDVDADLDLDLYVANDSNPNYLYINDGRGRFKEIGLWSGAALDAGGAAQAGMGIACGDYDRDGDVDIFVSNFAEDSSTLYRNEGRTLFVDVSRQVGVRNPTYQALSWGPALADFDLDGDLDLFIANGHIYPQAEVNPRSPSKFLQPNLLLANTGTGLEDVSEQAGPGLEVCLSSRGTACGDIDNDGDLDLVVSNVDAPPTLLRNDSARRGAWLIVDAPGAARVTVEAGESRWIAERVIGASYISVSDPRFHFGLGPRVRVDRLTVTWPDGTTTVRSDVDTDRLVRIERP